MKKYSYKDWWQGRICLKYSHRISNDAYISCSWEQIIDDDVNKIKNAQKRIFKTEVKTLVDKYINGFKSRYQSSELKIELLNDELFDFHRILWEKDFYIELSNNDGFQESLKNHTKLGFDLEEINEIQEYANHYIKQKNILKFDFIHSPNFQFHDKNEDRHYLRISAQAYWEYYQWLLKFKFMLDKPISNAYTYPKCVEWSKKINEFHNELIDKNFIHKKTPLEDFYNIFKDEKPSNPIIWLKNISDLAYLIKLIHFKYKFILNLEKKFGL